MTDASGFPPFKNARPKGSETGRLPPAPLHIEQVPREAESPEVQAVLAGSEPYNPGIVYPVKVCAKCGSREVREAVLIDGEVYIKVS